MNRIARRRTRSTRDKIIVALTVLLIVCRVGFTLLAMVLIASGVMNILSGHATFGSIFGLVGGLLFLIGELFVRSQR